VRLIVLFGPPAVGKMTVGRALAERTGLRLFHNHLTIEPVLAIFPFDSPPFARLVRSFREQIFDEVARSDLPGLVFTCMWSLDDERDKRFVDGVCDRFRARGAAVHFVELYATLEERLRRNRTEERLLAKPSKRDVAASEGRLLANEDRLRLNTDGDFFYPDDHLRIDNTDRAAEDVADEIIRYFDIPAAGTGT
jgi:hypothetical protein